MGWKLELVETCPASGARRMEVAWLGEVVAPASVDGIGLDHGMTQRLLGDIQHAVVALQEAALQAEADRRRRLDPTLRLKDYRLRRIQGLHGTLTIRVPHGAYRHRGTGAGAAARTGATDRSRERAKHGKRTGRERVGKYDKIA